MQQNVLVAVHRAVAAAAVVIVLVGVVYLFVHPSKRPASAAGQPATTSTAPSTTLAAPGTTAEPVVSRDYNPGDCVTWNQEASGAAARPAVVSCEQPHLVQVVATAQQIVGFGQTWPGPAALGAYAGAHCLQPAEVFLGKPLDPDGRFGVSGLYPVETSWLKGQRDLWCVIETRGSASGSGATLPTFSGTAKDASQEVVLAAGDCEGTVALAVPCDQPHQLEITGDVTLGSLASGPPTTQAGWQALVGTACDRDGIAFLGGHVGAGLDTGWLPISPASWAAGERVVQCVVGQPAAHGGWTTVSAAVAR
jgi:hypothetical protein